MNGKSFNQSNDVVHMEVYRPQYFSRTKIPEELFHFCNDNTFADKKPGLFGWGRKQWKEEIQWNER